MVYRVQFARSPDEPLPALNSMLEVEAASPMDAKRAAWRQSVIGPDLQLYARVVLGTLPNGNVQVLRVPLAGEAVPVDWTPGDVQ